MTRRRAVSLFSALVAAGALPPIALPASALAQEADPGRLGPAEPFSFEALVEEAKALAAQPYEEPQPSANAATDYDDAVRLTYGEAPAVAGNVRIFPASTATAPTAVDIFVVKDGMARQIVDTTGLYVDGGSADAAGFRVMAPGNRTDWLAYLGASYFRASGSRDQYGISARGIAIDTGLAKGEEFPRFSRFWFEETGPDTVRVHALLDGPSVTGAYAFDCRRSEEGVVQDIQASVFLRRDVEQLGLAAMSSMFWYDQASTKRADWRPEIHDSDGLSIIAGNGETIWRPLVNPAKATLHALRADNPRGFGLLQRDNTFDHYEDDGVYYDRRPSLWVEPEGDWGSGAVCLYEMPTDTETLDNIALFWRDDRPARAGDRRDFAYRLTWTSGDPGASQIARCVNRFEGPAGIPGGPQVEGGHKYVFDFEGPGLAGLDRDSGIDARTDLPEGALIDIAAYPVANAKTRWRVMIDLKRAQVPAEQFRLFLARGAQALSETVIQPLKT